MNGEARDQSSEAGTGTAPHPVLKKYYERESDRRPFVSALFDNGAAHYDWICGLGSMGSGRFYRHWILMKYGLRAGMKLLDVATGTGLVARAATRILREPGAVVGLDPSIGMLRQAQKSLRFRWCKGSSRNCRSRPTTSTSSAWATRCATWPTLAWPFGNACGS